MVKFIATTSDKLSSINVKVGQIIYSMDERAIYLDTDVRTSFQQIITLVREEIRQNLTSPVTGFYFVKDTKVLWNYEKGVWTQISGGAPKEQLYFMSRENFPVQGEEGVLYVDKDAIYQWDNETLTYNIMGGNAQLKWELIS